MGSIVFLMMFGFLLDSMLIFGSLFLGSFVIIRLDLFLLLRAPSCIGPIVFLMSVYSFVFS